MQKPITSLDHNDDNCRTDTEVSATSDLSELTTEPEELESKDSDMPPSTSGIDIHGHFVPDAILVALMDRSQEMHQLVQYNNTFFQTIKQHLGPTYWPAFENIMYSTRQQLPDKEWMSRIILVLKYNSHILNTFKELVGYIDDE